MDKEELKKKIVDIIRYYYVNEKDYGYIFDLHIEEKINAIADAFIAAGYGDVKEAEHRAKVLGRTLAIMKGKGLISGVVDDYIAQAEKELLEESKDD